MPAWVLHNAVLALPLAGAVWLVVRRLKPRPAVAHALWLLVVLRLALPPVVAWPWALPLPWAKQAAPVEAVAEPEVVSDSVSDVAYELVVVSGELLEEIPPPPPVEEVAPPPPFPWCWWLGVAWLTGTAVVAGVSVRQTWRLSREVRAAALAPPELLERVRRASRKLGVTPPLVRVTPALVSPVIIGFARPVLLWPVGLERKLTADGAAAVLAHELAHLKRRDHWVRWLELLAFVLHWWNPLFRPVRRRLR